MSTLTRFAVLTIVLIVLYLLVRNGALYKTAIKYGTAFFSKMYYALVSGRQDV
jgi:hypothetical protein